MKIIFDIGHTFVEWAIVSRDIKIIEQDKFITFEKLTDDRIKILYDKICKIINEKKEEHKDLKSVGISTVGIVDWNEGKIIHADESFKGYNGFKASALIEKKTGLDSIVLNQGNAVALGEFFELHEEHDNAASIQIGASVTGGFIIDGEMHGGHLFKSGEIGRTFVNGKHLDDEISFFTLVKNVSKRIGEQIDGHYVFANLDDPDIEEVYLVWLDSLAKAIINISNMLAPEVIIIGGRIIEFDAFKISDLNKVIKKYVTEWEYKSINIKPALLGLDASIIGIASYLKQKGL